MKMAHKHRLRETIITGGAKNVRSKPQESTIDLAVSAVVKNIQQKYAVKLRLEKAWRLHDIVGRLKNTFPQVDFFCNFKNSSMKPDGGIIFIKGKNADLFPILISEAKNQGTNDLRLSEGKPKQAKGNAIERLGKNVIGFRTALLNEAIFPFVCFGYGCDFDKGSSILDRVVTIAMFGQLNKLYLHNIGMRGEFNRGSFYFRRKEWSVQEMTEIMNDIAEKSIHYYYSKYGEKYFHA